MATQEKRRHSAGVTVAYILGATIVLTTLFVAGCIVIIAKGSSNTPVTSIQYRYGSVDTINPDAAGNPDDNKIAVITVEGIIADFSSGFLSLGTGIESSILTTIERAHNDPSVRAIVLDVQSPGGTVASTERIYHALQSFREDKEGSVIVGYARDIAASGGYYLLAASDAIFANNAAWIGSIGVIIQLQDLSEAYDTIGLRYPVIKSGTYKDMGSSSRPLTNEERSMLQSLVDESFQRFFHAVQEGRNLTDAELAPLAQGQIFSATQAAEHGLIDEAGTSLETTYHKAADLLDPDRTTPFRVVRFSRQTKSSLLDIFFHELLRLQYTLSPTQPLPTMWMIWPAPPIPSTP